MCVCVCVGTYKYVHMVECVCTSSPSPSSAPSPPVNINVAVVNSTSLSVSWGVPEFPQGQIEFYQVEYSSPCSSTVRMNTSNNITEAVLSGLSPSTEYRVRVRAFTVEFGDFSMNQTTITAEDGRLWLDLCDAWRRVCAWTVGDACTHTYVHSTKKPFRSNLLHQVSDSK